MLSAETVRFLKKFLLILTIILTIVLIINYTIPWIKELIARIKDLIEYTETREYKYAASKNSDVFHHINCSYVSSIKSDNLILFKTREEAIASGRRSCIRCDP